MALATGGFQISKITISQVLALLPREPGLFKESYFRSAELGHPLTIGWNKIEFFRDFCRYAGLIQNGAGAGEFLLSPLGQKIAHHDPNLADINTWWLLHANLALKPETNVYHSLFTSLPPRLLSKEEVIQTIQSVLGATVSETTIKKDVLAILGWFSDSPLAYLGVLVTDGQNWLRRSPSHLPSPYCIAYTAKLIQGFTSSGTNSMRLGGLLKGRDSLYTVFCLNDESFRHLLRSAADLLGSKVLSVSDTAGIDTIYFGNSSLDQIVEAYYLGRNAPVGVETH